MFASTAVLALSVLAVALGLRGAAAGSSSSDVNQLETPRLTQAAQRDEFGVEGSKSAFKFRFSDPVRVVLSTPRVPRSWDPPVTRFDLLGESASNLLLFEFEN